jgi:hypothetical protein
MTHAAAFVGDAKAGGPAQKFGEINARRFMDQFDFKFVGLVDFFGTGKGVDTQIGMGGSVECEPRAVC